MSTMITQVDATMDINDIPQYLLDLSIKNNYKKISMTECFYIFENVILRLGITLDQKNILDKLMETPGSFKVDIQKVLKDLDINAYDHDGNLKKMLIEQEFLPKDYKYVDTDDGKVFRISYKSCMIKKVGKRIAYYVGIIDLCVILCRINGTDPFVRYFSLHDKVSLLYSTYSRQLQQKILDNKISKRDACLDENKKLEKIIADLSKELDDADIKLHQVNIDIEDFSKKNKDAEVSINSKTIIPDELKLQIIKNERDIKKKKEILKKLKNYYYSQTT